MSTFDIEATAQKVTAYYDRFADAEWDRLTKNPAGLVSLELHLRMLRRHISPGMRVLEIGPGPGRYTLELAALGARMTIADISPVQLMLNETTVRDAGAAHAVDQWVLCDIRDVSQWPDHTFDAVIAYGGPLSYTFEQAPEAIAGLLRILRPGGLLLASVMSLLGTTRIFMHGIMAELAAGKFTFDQMLQVWRTGDLRHLPAQEHVCRMFTAEELSSMLNDAGAVVLEISATGNNVHCQPDVLSPLLEDSEKWRAFLDFEERASAATGALDGSTHLLFAAAKS